MIAKKIEKLNGGRFISWHAGNVTVYYDSRHKVIRTPVSGGFVELVLERQSDGSYFRQMLVTHIEGVTQILE